MVDEKVVEIAGDIYDEFLESRHGRDIWNEAREMYPEYNVGGDDTYEAVDFIMNIIYQEYENRYDEDDWFKIGTVLYDMVFDGLT